jgi:RNA polymerase primary sigma factor
VATSEFSQYLKNIRGLPLLSLSREAELSEIINGDFPEADVRAAVEELVESNVRLVINMAKNHSPGPESLPDLVAAGNVGLVLAAEKFDVRKKKFGEGRFTTHAWWHIKDHILDEIRRNCRRGMHVPESTFSYMPKVLKMIEEDPDISALEMSKALNISETEVCFTLEAINRKVNGIYAKGDESTEESEIQLVDHGATMPSEAAHTSELLRLVIETAGEVGADEEEIQLLSVAPEDYRTFVEALAAKRGVGPARIRMRKQELIWRIRKALIFKMGKEEAEDLLADKVNPYTWRRKEGMQWKKGESKP